MKSGIFSNGCICQRGAPRLAVSHLNEVEAGLLLMIANWIWRQVRKQFDE